MITVNLFSLFQYSVAHTGYTEVLLFSHSSNFPISAIVAWVLCCLLLLVWAVLFVCIYCVHRKLKQTSRLFVRRSVLDALTGLPERRKLLAQIEHEICSAHTSHMPASLLMLDIDHFKEVNDFYGYEMGDAVLREVARRMSLLIPAGQVCGRYGGDELVVLLSGVEYRQAYTLAEQIREAITATPLLMEYTEQGIYVTISTGMGTFVQEEDTALTLIEKAEQALHWAKCLGRNRVCTTYEAESFQQNSALMQLFDVEGLHKTSLLEGMDIGELRRNHLTMLYALLWAADRSKRVGGRHAHMVSDLAAAIAREMKLGEERIFAVATAALFHEIGMIGIPASSTNRAVLVQEKLVQRQLELGAKLLAASVFLCDLAPIVSHQCERWDGMGYPDGLAGEAIPVESRIIAVADTICTLLNRYPDDAENRLAHILRELQQGAGRRFDPQVVNVAVAILNI